MKANPSPTEFLVFHVVLTPALEALSPRVEEWLNTQAFGRRISSGPERDDLLTRHPLTCRVAGFASAAVSLREDSMVCGHLNASIGNEAQAIAMVAQVLQRHSGNLLTYSGNLRGLRLAGRRALLLGMPEKYVLGQVIGRSSDVADIAMQADSGVIPPLDVVADVLRLEPKRRAMSTTETIDALQQRDHTAILSDLVWSLEMTAKIYAATYYGDRLPLRWVRSPSPTQGYNNESGLESKDPASEA